MALKLQQLNAAAPQEAARMLAGLVEHSPWIAEQALGARPFRSLAHLKYCTTSPQLAALHSLGVMVAQPVSQRHRATRSARA